MYCQEISPGESYNLPEYPLFSSTAMFVVLVFAKKVLQTLLVWLPHSLRTLEIIYKDESRDFIISSPKKRRICIYFCIQESFCYKTILPITHKVFL